MSSSSREFSTVGYARANISTISEKAGFAKGTVYNYFGSKYDLLLAVIGHAMDLLLDQIREEIADLDDPVEKVKRAMMHDFRFMGENEALSKVIVREGFAADPQKQQELFGALAPASSFYIELIEEGKRAGRIRSHRDGAWPRLRFHRIQGH